MILADKGGPEFESAERDHLRYDLAAGRGGMTPDDARRLLQVALKHPQIRMFVSALGAPPPDVVEALRERTIVIVWLGTSDSELDEFERSVLIETGSDGTLRRKALTGKTVRMVGSDLSEAWEQPDDPDFLPTPLQGIRDDSRAEVMYRMQREFGEAMERLAPVMEG